MGIPSRFKRLTKKGELFWRHEHHLTGNDRIDPRIDPKNRENHRGGWLFFWLVGRNNHQKNQRKDLCYQLVWRRELSKKKVGSKMFWKRWGGWDDDGLRIGGVRKSPAANVLHLWYTKKCLKMDRWILLWRSCPIWKIWRSLPRSEAIKLGQGKAGKPRGESSHPAVKAKRGRGNEKLGAKHLKHWIFKSW